MQPADYAWIYNFGDGPVGLTYVPFLSKALGDYYGYYLYLPPSYDKAARRRFPVLYWLHGRGGTPRAFIPVAERLDAAIRAGRAPEMIAIGVNGLMQSMYCDALSGDQPVETILVKDLVPHVDETYRTVADRDHRAVEGFSMGGFGAAHLGFKYPADFGLISVWGAALHAAAFFRDERPTIFAEVFGNDLAYCRVNLPQTLAGEHVEALRRGHKIRIVVGAEDHLRPKNARLHELLVTLKVPHTYTVVPGAGHAVTALHDHFPAEGSRDPSPNPWAFYLTAW
jgi:endo-1,4-beta-xylanase